MFRKIMALFSSGKVVITDRLHMSIFALLLHKPHVILDQTYGKIRLNVKYNIQRKSKMLTLIFSAIQEMLHLKILNIVKIKMR